MLGEIRTLLKLCPNTFLLRIYFFLFCPIRYGINASHQVLCVFMYNKYLEKLRDPVSIHSLLWSFIAEYHRVFCWLHFGLSYRMHLQVLSCMVGRNGSFRLQVNRNWLK